MSSPPYDSHDLPTRYAQGYLAAAERLWGSDLGATIRRLLPTFLPGLSPAIVVAFIAPGSRTSNTTEGTGAAGLSVAFHEVGWFQVPAGLRDGPAPASDPNASHNAWGYLAYDPDVMRVLGRAAVTAPNAWRTAEVDQVAVGLANLRKGYRSVSSALPAALRPTSPDTAWGTALTFLAFSSGAGGAAEVVAHYAAAITAAPEAYRFAALVAAVAGDVAAGVPIGGTPDRHSNRAHRVLRTWQKFELARQLAYAVGADSRPFELGFGANQPVYEDLLVRGHLNLPSGGVGIPAAPTFTPDRSTAVLGVALFGVAAWMLWRASQTRPSRRRLA